MGTGAAAGATPEPGAVLCPKCHASLLEKDKSLGNIACKQCGTPYRYASLLPAASSGTDLANPPSGVRFERLPDGFTIAVSYGWELALTFAVVSYLFGMFGASLVYLPRFPTMYGWAHFLEPGMLLLIASPAVLMVAVFAVLILCRLRITRQGDQLAVSVGVGNVAGWTSLHRWSSFRMVYEGLYSTGRGYKPMIVLDGESRATFGRLLPAKRREFVLQTLRAMLAEERGTARPGVS